MLDSLAVSIVHLVSERNSGRPRGFAFVEMGSDGDAQKVIEALDGAELDGRNIKVNEAKEREKRGSGGGGGGYGGGGGGRGGGGDRW